MKHTSLSIIAVSMFITASIFANSPKGDWRKGFKTPPPKKGIDRIFVVNEGWKKGTLIEANETSVSLIENDRENTYPINKISLIQLSSFLDADKHLKSKDLKVKIEITGTSEQGTLIFNDGTIIKQVDQEPEFTSGADNDDKIDVTPTAIGFGKGRKDRSETTLSITVTLALANTKILSCDLYNNWLNEKAGSYTVNFINPETGKTVVTLKNPVDDLWAHVDIPVKKLSGSKKTKLDAIVWHQTDYKKMNTIPPFAVKPNLTANIIYANGKFATGKLTGIDEKNVILKKGKDISIPRYKIAYIELYEWALSENDSSAEDNVSKPILIVFNGCSSHGKINFAQGEVIDTLIMPPHFLLGGDLFDSGVVDNEKSLGFDKNCLDRSIFQANAIVRLKLNKDSRDKVAFDNYYTNILAGNMEVGLYDAKTGQKIMKTASKNRMNWEEKLPRNKMLSK